MTESAPAVPGQRKVQGVLAIILGIVPALMITLLPVAIDNFIPRG